MPSFELSLMVHLNMGVLWHRHGLAHWAQISECQRGLWGLLLPEGHPQLGVHLVSTTCLILYHGYRTHDLAYLHRAANSWFPRDCPYMHLQ
jgi:hypothetical protein